VETSVCYILENIAGDYLGSFYNFRHARDKAILMAQETGGTFKVIQRVEADFESQYQWMGTYRPNEVIEC
jgi:hypothetical protein